MKTLITLLTASVLFVTNSQAQFSENFDQNISGLASNCWVLNQVNYSTTSSDVINGTGSAYTNPPTSGTGERTIATPYLDVATTSLSVSFLYKTSSKINGNATRTITIGISTKTGVFTPLQTLTMDKNSPTTVQSHNATYTIAAAGTYRVELRIGGATGDGNSRVIFDDLNVSGTAHYGPTVHCNTPGTAVNDSYASGTISPVSGNVLTNDQFPADNEVYTPVLVAGPAEGTLVLNADGTFTYTPSATFTGGAITFTYQLVDDGYTAATSNIATVTINYPAPVLLPLTLLEFTATVKAADVELKWLVDKNYEGNYFEVEKSVNGKDFISIGKVFANNHAKIYSSYDKHSEVATYYRLKVINNDHSIAYSKLILVKGLQQTESFQIIGNPVVSVLKFSYSSATEENSPVQIYSIAGIKVQEVKMNMSKGLNQYSIALQNLQAGTYVMTVNSASGRQSMKFVKK